MADRRASHTEICDEKFCIAKYDCFHTDMSLLSRLHVILKPLQLYVGIYLENQRLM